MHWCFYVGRHSEVVGINQQNLLKDKVVKFAERKLAKNVESW